MAHTVKQVAAMSGVSVRTLHFYDETGLLKPAYTGANGYRFYEEPQLLKLQQILFYRELGIELKQIGTILGRADFEIAAALESHRDVLQQNLARTHALIHTINKTLDHLKGTTAMAGEEMFAGFSVAAGDDRLGEHMRLGGDPIDCKLSASDTGGAMSVFEFGGGWPRHVHRDQDEWVYVIEGSFDFEVGGRQFRLTAGESVFIPRQTPHGWSGVGEPGKVINVFRPAGTMENFFREIDRVQTELPTRDDVINHTYTDAQVELLQRVFDAHGMDILPPLATA